MPSYKAPRGTGNILNPKYTTPTKLRLTRPMMSNKCKATFRTGPSRRDLEASGYVVLWRQLKRTTGGGGDSDATLGASVPPPVNSSTHSHPIPATGLLDTFSSRQDGLALPPLLYSRREAVWCSLEGFVDGLLPDVGLLR